MGKNWVLEKKRDHYYRMAKRENYRSRASYKLKQLNDRFHIIKRGNRVVDLGSSPGGWSQVAVELSGDGRVVAVDIDPMRPIKGVTFIQGDMLQKETIDKIEAATDGKVDTVISDMAPNISGHYSYDHARSIELAEMALLTAERLLRSGGNFVVKVFQGDMFPDYLKRVKKEFRSVKVHSPKASRPSSSEVYVVCRGYSGIREDRQERPAPHHNGPSE